jgi:4-oxalocrotonate tautomerase
VLRTVVTRSQHIRVIVREVPRTHWATGDLTLHEMDAAGEQPTQTRRNPGDKEKS